MDSRDRQQQYPCPQENTNGYANINSRYNQQQYMRPQESMNSYLNSDFRDSQQYMRTQENTNFYVDEYPTFTIHQQLPRTQEPPSYSVAVAAGTRLQKPVVIPRVDIGTPLRAALPFMRAYSPDLRKHGVDERGFVDFIDNLAVAQAAPAPLQALDAAGQVVGVVPHHWAQAASAGMSVVAGVGTAAVSRMRTQALLEAVNRDFFAPRGLKASICKSKDLAAKLSCGEVLPVLESSGPVESPASITERRMRALAPYIAPLTFNVPPPSEQRTMLDKISAKQIQRRLKKRDEKQQKGLARQRNKKSADSDDETSSSSSDDEDDFARRIQEIHRKSEQKMAGAKPSKADKIEKKMDKKIRKIERKQEKAQDGRGSKSSKSERKAEKAARKQDKKADRMEFIIVENS